MCGKTFVVICSLLFVQLASARVVRDAPAAAEPQLDLNSLFEQANNLVSTVQGKIFELANVKNQEEFQNKIAKDTSNVVAKLTGSANDLKKITDENVAKIGEIDAVKQLRSRVDEAINNLKKENPDVAQNVEQLTKSTKSLVEGISNLGDSESAKQIKDIGNQILQTTVDALNDVKTKLQEVTAEKH